MRSAARSTVSSVKEAHGPFHHQQVWLGGRICSGLCVVRVPMQGTTCGHAFKNAAQPFGDAPCGQGLFSRGRRGFPAHPCVQIGCGLGCQRRMKGSINIVRPGLGRAGHEPARVQGTEQGQGKGRFARITARAAYDKAGYARPRLGQRRAIQRTAHPAG